MSRVASLTNPALKKIRFEGDDQNAAWSAESCVHILQVYGGDQYGEMEAATTLAKEHVSGDLAGLYGTVAAAVRKAEGEDFTDTDTGQPLDFSGDLESRVTAARRLTIGDVVAIAKEVNTNIASPFGATKSKTSERSLKSP